METQKNVPYNSVVNKANDSKKNLFGTYIDTKNFAEYEKQAQTDMAGYFGVYHVSIGQVDSIVESFENFINRIIE